MNRFIQARVVPEVGDQHARGEVVQPAAFGRPVVGAAALLAMTAWLGVKVRMHERLVRGQSPRGVGEFFAGVFDGGVHAMANFVRHAIRWNLRHALFILIFRKVDMACDPCERQWHSNIMNCSIYDRGRHSSTSARRARRYSTSPPRASLTSTTQFGSPAACRARIASIACTAATVCRSARQVVVSQPADLFQPAGALGRGAAEFDVGHLADEPLQHLDAVAALRALAPRFEKRAVVMIVQRDLALERRPPFDRAFHAALAAVAVPDAVVEAELHFLLDVAGKVVGRDPTGVNVEGRLAPIGVFVDRAATGRIPGRAVGRADQPALAGAVTLFSRPPNVKSISLM